MIYNQLCVIMVGTMVHDVIKFLEEVVFVFQQFTN